MAPAGQPPSLVLLAVAGLGRLAAQAPPAGGPVRERRAPGRGRRLRPPRRRRSRPWPSTGTTSAPPTTGSAPPAAPRPRGFGRGGCDPRGPAVRRALALTPPADVASARWTWSPPLTPEELLLVGGARLARRLARLGDPAARAGAVAGPPGLRGRGGRWAGWDSARGIAVPLAIVRRSGHAPPQPARTRAGAGARRGRQRGAAGPARSPAGCWCARPTAARAGCPTRRSPRSAGRLSP